MSVKIGSARIDENGKAKGGRAGDQSGKEVSTQSWYRHSKGWRVFRAKSAEVAERIARNMQCACDNRHIGYDQGQRLTLYEVSKPLGFDCKSVTTDCETDCSALVRVCCAYAGIMLPSFRTTTEPKVLLDSGAFVELEGSQYTDQDKYLGRGDILCTKSQGHTVVVLSNGSKYEGGAPDKGGDLRRGDEGPEVKTMQTMLLRWKPDCLPKYGADGDFGTETERAVKDFQTASKLPVTGVYDSATEAALKSATYGHVKITGGSVNVRTAPGASVGEDIGTIHKGDMLPYQGVTQKAPDGRDWYLIIYDNANGWVSSKYAQLAE